MQHLFAIETMQTLFFKNRLTFSVLKSLYRCQRYYGPRRIKQ